MSRAARAAALAALACLLVPDAASAGEARVTLELRGAGYARNDGGYADHARAFGFDGAGGAGGGALEAAVRLLPRLWLGASFSGFTSIADRRLDELRLTNRALLGHIGYTPVRVERVHDGHRFAAAWDVRLGAGRYTLSESLGGETRRAAGPGLRVGTRVRLYWQHFGLTFGYAYHRARPVLRDRLGGTIRAGGHEIGGGLALRF